MSKPYIRIYKGIKFYFLNPKPSYFDIEGIAHALSQTCRFGGNTKKFYSTAQHCCLVHDLLPDNLKAAGLLHDSCEQGLGDLLGPIKCLLPTYKEIERNCEKVLFKKFKLAFPMSGSVKEADLRLLSTEQRDLMEGDEWKYSTFPAIDKKITPWSITKSKREFLKRFYKLYPDYKEKS
jgi:hypothetical protein